MSGARTRRVICTWTSCTPGAATKARAALTSALAVRGLSGEAVSDAVLAVSELVANALEHASGPYEMALCSSDVEPLICEVRDRDPRVPVLPPFSTTAPFAPNPQDRGGGLERLCTLLSERGRGLQIVNYLSRGCWGFHLPGDGTKIAWIAIGGS